MLMWVDTYTCVNNCQKMTSQIFKFGFSSASKFLQQQLISFLFMNVQALYLLCHGGLHYPEKESSEEALVVDITKSLHQNPNI